MKSPNVEFRVTPLEEGLPLVKDAVNKHYNLYNKEDIVLPFNMSLLLLMESHKALKGVLAYLDGEVVGYAVAALGPSPYNEGVLTTDLLAFWVNEDARGQGVGRSLVSYVEGLWASDVCTLHIPVGTAGESVAKELGYHVSEVVHIKKLVR